MKIAIIGTGVAGNVAAYHLNKHHDIAVFETNDYTSPPGVSFVSHGTQSRTPAPHMRSQFKP